jgi:CDP-diacylglycerol--glycerol-3-phosphate 3-phosphatidyltransferase
MFDGKLRAPVDKAVRPIGALLRRTGLSPDHLTILGVIVAIGAGFAIGTGRLLLGFGLVILAALPDLLDGALAKASNQVSQRGAFFDSVIDRVTDAILFSGVAYYYAAGKHPRLSMIAFGIMAISAVISYERAKAESLGLEAKGGIMERAERIILLELGLLIKPLLLPILWVMLALCAVTAVQRFIKVWKQAGVTQRTAAKMEIRRSRRQSRRVRTDRLTTRIPRRRPNP